MAAEVKQEHRIDRSRFTPNSGVGWRRIGASREPSQSRCENQRRPFSGLLLICRCSGSARVIAPVIRIPAAPRAIIRGRRRVVGRGRIIAIPIRIAVSCRADRGPKRERT